MRRDPILTRTPQAFKHLHGSGQSIETGGLRKPVDRALGAREQGDVASYRRRFSAEGGGTADLLSESPVLPSCRACSRTCGQGYTYLKQNDPTNRFGASSCLAAARARAPNE